VKPDDTRQPGKRRRSSSEAHAGYARCAAYLLTLLATACAAAEPQDCVRVVSWAGYREVAMDEEIIDSFSVRHPDIPVCYESLEGSGIYREKILTSIAAGTPPGVFLLDGIDIPSFVNRGVVLDLAPFIGRVGLTVDAFHPAMRDLFESGGRLWAFPKDFTPMVLYYNKDLFDAARVPYPDSSWSWDDFLDAAQRLTRDTDGDGEVDQWGFAWPREFFYLQTWIWTGGGDLLSPDGRRATGHLDSPETVAALEWYLDLTRTHGVAPRIEMFRRGLGQAGRLFYSGRVAMMQSGHWNTPTLLPYEERGELRFGVAPVPRAESVPPVSPIYASGWAVPRNAPHRRWAVTVAAFLSGEIAQRIRARSGLGVPGMPIIIDEIVAADTTGREAVFVAAAAHGRQPWGTRVEQWRELEDLLLDVLDRPLVRGEPVSVVARDIARRIDALLADGARASGPSTGTDGR
jgi:multiple sugar transport system substrate-binding protein